MRYAVPFDYDAWKTASPEYDRGGSRTCDGCAFYRDVEWGHDGIVEYVGVCVRDVWDAEDADALSEAEVVQVDPDFEVCDSWEEA